jgi:hypothetical protein
MRSAEFVKFAPHRGLHHSLGCRLHPSGQKRIYIGYTCVYLVVRGTCIRLR